MLQLRLAQSIGWQPIEPAKAPSIQRPHCGPRPLENCSRTFTMKFRKSWGDAVKSTHGSHSRKYARLRSTTAKIGSASVISNRRISIPGATLRENIPPLTPRSEEHTSELQSL